MADTKKKDTITIVNRFGRKVVVSNEMAKQMGERGEIQKDS